MAKIVYEAIAKAGTYKDRESGAEKTRYHKCGVVFESDKGLSVKIESLPINFDGWLSLRAPQQKNAPAPAPKTAPAQSSGAFEDDIPF